MPPHAFILQGAMAPGFKPGSSAEVCMFCTSHRWTMRDQWLENWSFQMVVPRQWSPATNTLLLFSSAPWAYFWNHNQDTVGRNVCFWNSGIVAAAISHGWGAPNQLTKTIGWCAGSKRKHLSSTCANSGKALDCIFNPRKNRFLLCTCWKSIICFIGTF